jgi:CHAD domain-containing protein
MAFRFKRRESIAGGFARIAAEQIREAVFALEQSSDEGVHEARKCIKRLRALLRLFRKALPDGSYERENETLRAAAGRLSSLRDAQVRIAVFDSLVRGLHVPGVTAARNQLFSTLQAAAVPRGYPTPPMQATITTLRTVGARLPGLKPDASWSVLARGLRATYRRARKAHAAAHEDLATPAMHTWRRRSKDFEYQMQLLSRIDAPGMKRCIRDAGRLTEYLGDHHDLAVLERTLAGMSGFPPDLRGKLCGRIAKHGKKLERRAFKLGSSLFFEKPTEVVKELGRGWKRWRRG